MKIYSIEVATDRGRRVVQVSAPFEVDLGGDMPPQFRSLIELLWKVMRQFENQSAELAAAAPKAEA